MLAHESTRITSGLPDMYTLSPRACGPRASSVYIRQTTRVHGITIIYIHVRVYIYVCVCVCTYNYINIDIYTRIYTIRSLML